MELGRGGMGVTYKAIDTHLRCPVALKIIRAQFIGNESARSRFLREARAAASVCHSNVATVHHLGESGGNYFYAMEFVDGETLEALLHRRGRLEIDLALEIVAQVAAGLTAIHKQHLVHRDIKPSNIMLTWEGWIGKRQDHRPRPGQRSYGRHAFDRGKFYWNSHLCESGTVCRTWDGYPF